MIKEGFFELPTALNRIQILSICILLVHPHSLLSHKNSQVTNPD